jgi:maltose alpha-D-glucosyltransferase/alpha-amylase
LENDRRKIGLAYSLMFTLPGSPVLYYGDEIGMGDDIRQFDRNGVRTPMQWDDSKNGGFSSAEITYLPVIDDEMYGYKIVNVQNQNAKMDSNLNWIKNLIKIRKSSDALGFGDLTWLTKGDEVPVLAYKRQTKKDCVVVIHNMTEKEMMVPLDLETGSYHDLIVPSVRYTTKKDLKIILEPRQFLWLQKENV